MTKKEQIQPSIYVGLDIGTTKISTIILSPIGNENLNVIGYSQVPSEGIQQGNITNLEKAVVSIRKAITLSEQRAGVTIRSVVVGISGEHIQSFQSRGVVAINNPEHEITSEDVHRLLHDTKRIALPPDRIILDVFPQEYIIDGQGGIVEPVGMSGVRMEGTVHIITCLMGVTKNIQKCLERVGVRAQSVILQQLASANAVLIEEEKQLGVALVDIGGGTTDVAVYADGVLRYTSSVPCAGNHVTQDIRKGLGILQEQAEQIKREFGCAFSQNIIDDEPIVLPGIAGRSPVEISKETLCRIIQPRMEEIYEYVAEELQRSGFAKQLSAGIVLTGGGAMLNGAVDLSQTMFGMVTKLGIPFGFTGGLVKEIEHPAFATCAGLALSAFRNRIKSDGDEVEQDSSFKKVFQDFRKWMKQI